MHAYMKWTKWYNNDNKIIIIKNVNDIGLVHLKRSRFFPATRARLRGWTGGGGPAGAAGARQMVDAVALLPVAADGGPHLVALRARLPRGGRTAKSRQGRGAHHQSSSPMGEKTQMKSHTYKETIKEIKNWTNKARTCWGNRKKKTVVAFSQLKWNTYHTEKKHIKTIQFSFQRVCTIREVSCLAWQWTVRVLKTWAAMEPDVALQTGAENNK